MDSVSLCNLSSKCTTDVVNNGHRYVNDVKVAGELGQGSIKKSMLGDGIVGNNEFDEGCFSNNYPDNKMSVLVNDDNNMPGSEGDSKLSGNVGVQVGKVEDCAEKSDDVSFSHETSSPTSIEVSGNGINLFVEVFGPLDGVSESNSDLNGEGKECSSVRSGNINIAPGVRNLIFKNQGEKNVGEQECMFEVGDLVWVKTRTPPWWPGTICDPSNASNDETKPEKKGTALVKYFGNANLIWSNNLDLKPFIEYYEQLSRQNTSRSFSVAVERALCEIGRRVNSKMTCPCFSKGKNENQENKLMPVEKKGKIDDVLSLARFEPMKVLTCIKQFATSSYPPSKIELTVMENRVSSFYRSIGHCQLPLQMISELKYQGCYNNNISGGREKSMRAKKKRNPSDYNDLASSNKIASSGKGSESRDRKKIKSDEIFKLSISSKKGLGKSSNGHHVISKEDNINASSSELLAELCLTASEHFYLERSKYSDSLTRFYSSFRMYTFLDADIADKEGRAQPTSKYEKSRQQNSSKETKRKNKEISMVYKKSVNPSSNFEYVKESLDNNPVAKKISKRDKSREKKEERVMSACVDSKKNYHDISCMISFQKTCSDVPKSKSAFKNNDDPISRLPDLNKNSPIPVKHVPFGGPSEISFMPLQEHEIEGLVSRQNIPQLKVGIINDADQRHHGESTALELSLAAVNTGLTSPVQQSPQMMVFDPKTDPKKRRTGKNSELASMIPDLNRIASDMNSSGKKYLPDGPEGKPQQKRGNREEDPGGSVILKFAPGSDLPSKETLVARFSRYGLVKESEILVINDSTVQIAYERTPDARFAFRSLEKGHSFGESLIGFDLNCVPEKKIEKKMRKNLVMNVGACKMPARPADKPEIAVMKQNVEMMKSTLEKMGDKISPDMRVKLENEIKAFLDKIGSMSGSSSLS